MGPPHGFQADPDDVGIIWQADLLVVREETELTIFSLSIVKHDGALPAAFLVMVELAQVGDDPLSWPGLGAYAFHQGVVGVRLLALQRTYSVCGFNWCFANRIGTAKIRGAVDHKRGPPRSTLGKDPDNPSSVR